MNISIKLRIYLSFLLLALLFVANGIFSGFIIYKNKQLSSHISEVIDPSLKALDDFHDMIMDSKMYATNWVFLRSSQADKDSLLKIHGVNYRELKTGLQKLSAKWQSQQNCDSLQALFRGFENLLFREKKIMGSLQTFDDYNDPVLKLQAENIVEEEIIPMTAAAAKTVAFLEQHERAIKLTEDNDLERATGTLRTFILILAVTIIILGFLLSKYLTEIIVKPIGQIRSLVKDLSKGVTHKIEGSYPRNEIGRMVHAVNELSDKLQYIATFAQQVGERHFDVPFRALSEEDSLGKAVLAMRDKLKSVDESLNQAQRIARLGSWELNVQTGTVFWSDEMYAIFGEDPSTFKPTDETAMASVHPEEREEMMRLIGQSLRDHQPFSCEHRIKTKSGQVKHVYAQGNVFTGDEGKVTRIMGVVQDITERKKAEVILEAKNEELKMKNKELEQFAYVASHDLQEPLRTISSFSNHLQEQYLGKLDENANKFIHFIVQSTDRMQVLIKDLLDYSRIGRMKQLKRIDCNEIVKDVVADLDTAIRESTVEIKTDNLPVIHGYCTELKQLFQNLVVNAIKFRRKEVTPQIHISSKVIAGGWEFKVEDNGIGIEQEHSERIFVIFQRLHTRAEYAGSGIGLSHCKKIVELHGGRIWVKSTPGEGSSFCFTILENRN